MPTYDRTPATDLEVVDRWDDGVGWLAHPHETGRRASHAVRADDGAWVIDPLDAPGVDDLLAELGTVAGVAVLGSHHARDAGPIADRHDVAVHVPTWMDRVAERVDAPVERYGTSFGESGFEVQRVEPLGLWQEGVAYRESDGTLYVPDLLGAGPGYTVGDERVGVVLSNRLTPPRDVFEGLTPERILLGHGRGVLTGGDRMDADGDRMDADEVLEDALSGARRRFPRAVVGELWTNVRLMAAAMGE